MILISVDIEVYWADLFGTIGQRSGSKKYKASSWASVG